MIVPGGGMYADRVRSTQRKSGFDDRSAHRLALLAMVQYGHVLLSLQPDLCPAVTREDIRTAWQSERTPVWLPLALFNDESEIPANWDWSSDSISLWLALKLHADLCLVKSVAPAGPIANADDLQQAGIIDHAFPQLLSKHACSVSWLGAEQHTLLANLQYACRIVTVQPGTQATDDRAHAVS